MKCPECQTELEDRTGRLVCSACFALLLGLVDDGGERVARPLDYNRLSPNGRIGAARDIVACALEEAEQGAWVRTLLRTGVTSADWAAFRAVQVRGRVVTRVRGTEIWAAVIHPDGTTENPPGIV